MASTPAPRTSAPKLDTRERILQAAAELFARNSYAGTSLADIAAVLGTTRGALFYHFPAKSDILDELMADADRVFAELTERGGPPDVILREVIDVYADSGYVTALLSDLSSIADHAQRHDIYGMADDMARKLVLPNSDRADVVRARAALAAIREATLQWMEYEDPLSEETRELIVEIGMRTLGEPG